VRRRDVIFALGGSAFALTARAAPPLRKAHLGYIWVGPEGSEDVNLLAALRHGLADLGYTEGRDFVIEARYADSSPERIRGLLSELIRLRVDLILTPGTPSTLLARELTSTTPILALIPDLLASGFVANLAHPGGNVTGLAFTAGPALAEKWLQTLKECVPDIVHVAFLWNPINSASAAHADKIEQAARALGITLTYATAQNPSELDSALASIATAGVSGLVVDTDAIFVANRSRIIAFADVHRFPAIYGLQSYVRDGGLMSYGADLAQAFGRMASYVDKILSGAKPADLPVEQSTRFALLINLKTARTLGLDVPPYLLARADEVIE
jgi:putative tryptophan/tyrosine transport system substrate-binding protein